MFTEGSGYWLYNWLEKDGREWTVGTVYGLHGWVQKEEGKELEELDVFVR